MILLYHKIYPESPTLWWVDVDRFHQDLLALRGKKVVYLDDFDPADPDHAVITFDGIYADVLKYAGPLLQDFGYPFELFLSGDHVGKGNEFDQSEPFARFADRVELQKLVAMGGRLQWHSASHRDLRHLDDQAEIVHELTVPAELRELDTKGFGWFAYPHGEFDDRTLALTRERFRGAVSCNQGDDQDRHKLNRLTVFPHSESLPRASVALIVASYNYGRFLIEAVDSVMAQSQMPDEIHIVDDCSDDNTPEICRLLEQAWPGRLTIHRNPVNLGIEANFNAAVARTEADFVCFLGADNRLTANYVEELAGSLERNRQAAVAYCDFALFGPRAALIRENFPVEWRGRVLDDCFHLIHFPEYNEESLALLENRNFIHGSSMYRRAAFDQVGGYSDRRNGAEDYQLFKSMLQAGWQAVRNDRCLLEYRQHSRDQANEQLNQGTALRFFEEQNRRLLAEIGDLSGHLQHARKVIAEKDLALTDAAQAFDCADRDSQARLAAVRFERDVALESVSVIQRSFSWRLTMPLRMLVLMARGQFVPAANMIGDLYRAAMFRLPPRVAQPVSRAVRLSALLLGADTHSRANSISLAELAALRLESALFAPVCLESITSVRIDISVVTFNSAKWIDGFVDSLLEQAFPASLARVVFVDNGSTDASPELLRAACRRLKDAGFEAELLEQANLGYGAGHDAAIRTGSAEFCLVTNLDLTFEKETINRLVNTASHDSDRVAAWEARQKPFEHPKLYDPVTRLTSWNSHACVLLRRKAYEQVGGYDRRIFMYGEDVEISYALRSAGHLLRVCPEAVVWHFSYDSPNQVKPVQYLGSTFANLYLRLKYGNILDMMSLPFMNARLVLMQEQFPGARKGVLRNAAKLIAVAPATIASRRHSVVHHPFRDWDYEMVREGAFVESMPLPDDCPLITVITRTYQGREGLLIQAIASVRAQTWPHIEHIIVEDGGLRLQSLVETTPVRPGYKIVYRANAGQGRSHAGNSGLAAAHGRWCLFLDDDDLLFADHLETLANALLSKPGNRAAYALAWEVATEVVNAGRGDYLERSHIVPPLHRQPFNYETLKRHNFMAIQSVLFDRSLHEERGGFDVDMDALEDWLLWIKYGFRTQFSYVPKVTSMYRVPSDTSVNATRALALTAAYENAAERARTWLERAEAST